MGCLMRQLIFSYFHGFMLIGLMGYIVGGTWVTPFHADEADHLFKSQDYVAYFVLHDPLRLRVDPPVAVDSEQHIRLLTGTTSAYLTGLVLWHTGTRKWPSAWYYPDTIAENRQAGRWPEKSVLWRGRIASATLTALSVLLVYAIGEKLHLGAGIFAAILFTLHPVILLNGRRVMQEGALMFFTLLLVWQAIRTAENPSWKNWLGLGLVMGVAFASKPTAILAILGVGIGLVFTSPCMFFVGAGTRGLYMSRLFSDNSMHPIPALFNLWLLVGVIFACITYLILTPAIWNNPPARLMLAAQLRQEVLQGQTQSSEHAYHDLAERGFALISQSYPTKIQYFESPEFGEDSQLQAEIQMYQKSIWRGVRYPPVVGMGLALIGAIYLLIGIKTDSMYAVPTPAQIIFLSWTIITLIGLFLSVPLGWQRYYLLLTLVAVLLGGLGLDFLSQSMHAMFRFLRR